MNTENGHLDFLGYPPCFLENEFREGIDGLREGYWKETGRPFQYYIPPHCSNEGEEKYRDAWRMSDIDEFPDIVASEGFDDLFRKKFIVNMINKRYFESAGNYAVEKPFDKAGFNDPDGWYTVYAIAPYILFIDKKKLNGIPPPARWSDVLQPRFRNHVIVSGWERRPSDVTLLYFYKEFGEEGIRRLAGNTKAIWHAARITRTAGTSDQSGAAIYIQPLFCAECCPRTEATSIIWPEDGAHTSPVYFLVKKSEIKRLSIVTNYLLGPELGRKYVRAGLLSLNSHVDNNLPENATFQWLGWDYIKSHDIPEQREMIRTVFVSELEKNGKGANNDPLGHG